jgi:hypothetical protein
MQVSGQLLPPLFQNKELGSHLHRRLCGFQSCYGRRAEEIIPNIRVRKMNLRFTERSPSLDGCEDPLSTYNWYAYFFQVQEEPRTDSAYFRYLPELFVGG